MKNTKEKIKHIPNSSKSMLQFTIAYYKYLRQKHPSPRVSHPHNKTYPAKR